jgi:hypothetical protein
LQRAVIFDGRIDRSLQRPQVGGRDTGLWGQHLELMIEMCREMRAKFMLRESLGENIQITLLRSELVPLLTVFVQGIMSDGGCLLTPRQACDY